MPGGIVNNLDNLFSSHVINRPYITLFFVVFLIILLIFGDRLLGFSYAYSVYILIGLFSIIIATTIFQHNVSLTDLFHSTSSRNFMSVMLLIFFIMFVYEDPEYSNNELNKMANILTFGNNKHITNRMVGIGVIITFSLVTAYTIYLTTREK